MKAGSTPPVEPPFAPVGSPRAKSYTWPPSTSAPQPALPGQGLESLVANDKGLRFVLTLTVISYNGKPSPAPMSANFDEFGGTIGRADNNLMVLPDQERTVSRIHAQIVFRNGRFALVDRGSNPILVNGRALGNGREVAVSTGTELRIGGYVLRVQEGASSETTSGRAKSRDPFVDLFGPAKAAANGRAADDAMDPLQAFRAAAAATAPDTDSTQITTGRTGPRPAPPLPSGWDLGSAETTQRRPTTLETTQGGRSTQPAELQTGYPARSAAAANQSAVPVESVAVPAPVVPKDAVLSWDAPDATRHTVIRVGQGRAEPGRAALFASSAASPASAAAIAAAPGQSVDARALLEAFREGLAAPGVRVDALTPEFMRLLGQLLHANTSGAVELLLTRAAVKREVRASSTVLVAQENNPLKFSPTGAAALAHLLAPPAPGFMPAVPAVRDAFEDLAAHQAGLAAGLRAALDDVLARFDPEALEARLVQKSFLQTLVPGKRQSRMWEAFGQFYAQIRQEASDDFQTLLGKEFLKAYEGYVQSSKESPR